MVAKSAAKKEKSRGGCIHGQGWRAFAMICMIRVSLSAASSRGEEVGAYCWISTVVMSGTL